MLSVGKRNGATLAEALIVALVLVVLGVIIGNYSIQNSNSIKKMDNKSEFLAFQAVLSKYGTSEARCLKLFGGAGNFVFNGDGTGPPANPIDTPAKLYTLTSGFFYNGVYQNVGPNYYIDGTTANHTQLGNLTFTNIVVIATGPPPSYPPLVSYPSQIPGKMYLTTELWIQVRTPTMYAGAPDYVITMPLTIRYDANTLAMESCTSTNPDVLNPIPLNPATCTLGSYLSWVQDPVTYGLVWGCQ